jgi:hypothetical protein
MEMKVVVSTMLLDCMAGFLLGRDKRKQGGISKCCLRDFKQLAK